MSIIREAMDSVGRPHIRKYTYERPDGTIATRWEVLDRRGLRVPGQGTEGFDSEENAKMHLKAYLGGNIEEGQIYFQGGGGPESQRWYTPRTVPNQDQLDKTRESAIIKGLQLEDEDLSENLRKWFKEKWVRFNPSGKIMGPCARGDESEGKPKCLPQSKAHALGKKGRASAAARKRREDPNPERRGPAKNVATKKKVSETVSNDETSDDYRGMHRAPGRGSGSPMHDLSNTYPDDIYGPKGAEYYGHYGQNNPMDRDSVRKIRIAKNNPGQAIQIYRAVPKNIKNINPGDWVTINKDYAREHSESALRGDYKIISKIVSAKHLYTDGNSIHEWGSDPGSSISEDNKKLTKIVTEGLVDEITEQFYSLVEWKKAARKLKMHIRVGYMAGTKGVKIYEAETEDQSSGGRFFAGPGWNYGHITVTKQDVAEAEDQIQLGPQLFVSRQTTTEGIKPRAMAWTSTAQKTDQGFTSDWVEWCKDNMAQWVNDTGILYDVAPGARILLLRNDRDVIQVARRYGLKIKNSSDLFEKMDWDVLRKDYDAIHYVPQGRTDFMSVWDVESTAWFDKKFLTNPRKVKIDTGKTQNIEVIGKQDVAEEQLDELKCWPGYTRVRGVSAGAPGSCKKKINEDLDDILYWTHLSDTLTIEEKLTILEEYYSSKTIINESNDAELTDYFSKLTSLSDMPAKNKKYLLIFLGLINNKVVKLQTPEQAIVLSKEGNVYKIQFTDGRVEEFPEKTIRNKLKTISLFFSNNIAYDKLRTILSLKFNFDGLEDFDSYTKKKTNEAENLEDKINLKELKQLMSIKKEVKEEHSCPHCGGEMVSEELMNEKKDACYYKVKSRYKVWPSAYASGALVKCRKVGAKNWGTKSESISETEGLPYPGTYEQETLPFRKRGQRRTQAIAFEEKLDEKWSEKYKRSIDCSRPRGFSQRAHCQGRKKK